MSFLSLWSPRWSTGEAPLADLATAFLEEAPRVAVEARGVLWVDARGLSAERLAHTLLERGGGEEAEIRAGISAVPVAAELAARSGDAPVTVVRTGGERAFLDPLPLRHLEPDPRLLALLEGVGIHCCGALAALPREGVEVRFGAGGSSLWKLARADDSRLLFRPIPRERESASIDFVDYAVRDAARLAFTANALLGSVCAGLERRGERAREMTLILSLAGGGRLQESLRAARPTAERTVWLRRLRERLEDLRLPDAVSGVALRVEAAEAVSGVQGDLFDRGFATAAPVEEAVTRLVDAHGALLVRPEPSGHPLADRRTEWNPRAPAEAAESGSIRAADPSGGPGSAVPALTLQLLPEPRRVTVRTAPRRDHTIPVEFLDRAPAGGRRWRALAAAAGPERVSGGGWEEGAFAREYFRCVTEEGVLVWLFREGRGSGGWYLHGWWD